MNKVMFSSKKEDWETPEEFFKKLNEEFKFTLDPCANEFNHKVNKYYTVNDNGLEKDRSGEIVYCNPPYGRNLYKWVEKCCNESKKDNTIVVMLIPSRTDTKYFHNFLYNKDNIELRFIKGRLKFVGAENTAPFPSLVVVMR